MRLLRYGGAWVLDYAYVAYWQVHGFLFRRDASQYLHGERPPVLLIPGIYETWQFMHPVADHLNRRGHPVHVVSTLGYNRGTVTAMAARVAAYLEEQQLTEVIIVAHSKGGLIGKYVMTEPASAGRIRQLVAVNSPFSGSIYASFAVLPSLRAFSPRNRTLKALHVNLEANARITSVYSSFDPHIPGGSELPGAVHVRLETMGHFRILGEEGLLREVDRAILLGEPPSDAG
ncbi:alpha/beta fold hydrolase [Arthrobacter sp. H5]|uniref:esterase/lipase family protein n=1 Tax=Arthrobacter sp. H5 TaxID=1267973 RepID=UPI00055DF3B5|nr:alpha/beta fold hydrolase [Arthrobacter sp. H5]